MRNQLYDPQVRFGGCFVHLAVPCRWVLSGKNPSLMKFVLLSPSKYGFSLAHPGLLVTSGEESHRFVCPRASSFKATGSDAGCSFAGA